MCISDWSSDVCASDLADTGRRAGRPRLTGLVSHGGEQTRIACHRRFETCFPADEFVPDSARSLIPDPDFANRAPAPRGAQHFAPLATPTGRNTAAIDANGKLPSRRRFESTAPKSGGWGKGGSGRVQ